MTNLPESGVNLVAKGAAIFERVMQSATNAIKKQGEAAAQSAKKSTSGNTALGKSIGELQERYLKLVPGGQASIDMLTKFTGSLGISTAATLAAVAAVAALAVGLIALGTRGAALTGLAESFDRLTASVGLSSKALLVDLRKAAAGTVSDFDLIRRSNLALAGATGEFGRQFAQNLPKILEIARTQARATGQDVDFLFQSLVTGIKRASPLLIDNTGIVLKIGAANETLAEQLGKTVEQLTAEEKQIAVLNATLAAGQTAIDALGNSQETAAEKIARAQATVTNILDRLGLSVQPGFELILDGVNRILGVIEKLAGAIGVFLSPIVELFGSTFKTVVDIVLSVIEPIVDAVLSFVPYLGIAFEGVVNLLRGIQGFISDAVSGIVDVIRWLLQNILGVADFAQLGPALFNGAAAAFGSFANGIITVANQLIFPAVIGIATFIADFLIGFSPPKKGPLSHIDEGGKNVMLSWLEGLVGVSLDPVNQVAAEVSAMLGNIGKATLPQVNSRLAQLDKALLPFQNRLSIVKSTFDAIAEPAKLALDAIDRQMGTALEALARGEAGSGEAVRRLDAQRAAIQAALDGQQRLTDAAQIQLALASAQQTRERALLAIRKAQLELAAKVTKKAGKKPKQAPGGAGVPTEDLPTGSGGTAPDVPSGGGAGSGIDNSGADSVLDMLTGGIDEARAGIQDAFAGEIDVSQLGLFEENAGRLQEQLNRFSEVDIGKAITDKLAGIGPAIGTAINEAATVIGERLRDLGDSITNPEREGSIPYFLNTTLPTQIDAARGVVSESVNKFFDNIFNPDIEGTPAAVARDLIDSITNPEREGSIPYFLNTTLPEGIDTARESLEAGLRGFFNLFDPNTKDSPAASVKKFVETLTGDSTVEGSIANFFSLLPTRISEAAAGLFDQLQETVFDPVSNFLNGTGEGTLAGIIDGAVAAFELLPGRIVEVLRGLGASVYGAVAVPLVGVLNSVLELIERGLQSVAGFFSDFIFSIANPLSDAGIPFPQGLLDLAGQLGSARLGLRIPRISTALPAFLTAPPPEGATGGIFGEGVMSVGERGRELVASAGRMAVFPNSFVQAIEQLTQAIIAQPVAMPVGMGGVYNDSHNINATFNGVQGAGDVVRKFSRLKAGR